MESRKSVLIEKNPNFSIVGVNDDGPFEIRPTSFMHLPKCPKTAIVIVTVAMGVVQKGNPITLSFSSGKLVKETAQNLQVQGEDVSSAEVGTSVGIQLSEMTFQDLMSHNGTSESCAECH